MLKLFGSKLSGGSRRVLKLKLLTVFKLTVVLVVALAAAWVFGTSNKPVSAHEISSSQEDEAYSYVAQPGDSYTKMARKAIQTFWITEKIDVSQAGIIFAETNLTKAAGSPALDVGQKVEIKVPALNEWVDKAQELTDAQEATWDYYVQFVDFNTNGVGQPS